MLCGLPFLCHRFEGKEKSTNKGGRPSLSSRPAGTISGDNPRYRAYKPKPTRYLGIDGEGQGRREHKYIFLACSDEQGLKRWSVENPQGLSTQECFDFLMRLPTHHTKIFAYAFSYDLTKMMTDIDNRTLYILFRPELRQRKPEEAVKGPKAVRWHNFMLNYQGSKFTIQQGRKKIVIWDIFKFFQSKFVNALRDWKVGNVELWDRMQKMKDQRADFDKLRFSEVKEYCFEECACMAELARKLTEAHVQAGLILKSYYGAGSSASAMLDIMGIREKLQKNYPPEMEHAISCAFFGGRFENSVVGPIYEKVYNYDISSAYPYQLYFLPCLVHGRWELTTDRKMLEASDVTSGLVHYELRKTNPGNVLRLQYQAWGPFPFRTKEGSICFPKQSGGGWVYRDEYLQGERLFSYVGFKEAWIYRKTCDCIPFQKIPTYYCERCRIGKEGPGIVIKLGCNSCYGKLAQSVGNALFNSWLYAGLITSGCRAQLLELLGLHQNWKNALMMATDGLCTREKLVPPKPRNTETWHAMTKGVATPLGGWEEKSIDKGMFFARPGIYFPMNPTLEEIKDVRGRGVGKGVVLENWKRIVEAWPTKHITDTVAVTNVTRFCGAKSSISQAGKPGAYLYHRAEGHDSKPSYGQWISRKVEMSFNPLPKRLRVRRDGRTLVLRKLPVGVESTAYDPALQSEDKSELGHVQNEALEQPDCDLSDYS